MNLILIILGLGALILGATWLVEGASDIARRMGISALTIGLTVVAFGTSAPELSVNLISAFEGSSEIAMGNILGSNIFNTFMILGLAALVKPVGVQNSTIKIEIPFFLLSALVLTTMSNGVLFDGATQNIIPRSAGIILLLLFGVFMYYNFLTGKEDTPSAIPEIHKRKFLISFLMIFGGLAFLIVGGKLIVTGAVNMAIRLGVSQAVIGLTIVAAGTSLPELATSVVAAYRNKPDIAIGNVVGSNIFNILFILGTTAVINPMPLYQGVNIDLGLNVLAALLMFAFAIVGPGRKFDRREGIILICIYIIYLTYQVLSV